ncbi:sensor domain-containing protein [Amphibacillus sediminis]|uniref:sensor domain-containing protein n=1 Tax=Amphibacillus sediminis TaxID=360185 RepID=UPI00082D2FC3|nr:diguanylate cyclase [Amphibacillus sediminis]
MEIMNQNIIDGIQEMVFVMRVSADANQFFYLLINKKAREQLGMSNELIGCELREVLAKDKVATVVKQYQETAISKKPSTYEDTYYNINSYRVSETTLTPIIEEGKVTMIVAVTRDITAIKKAEQQTFISNKRLQLSRKRYKSLFDENTDAIAYMNGKGRLIKMNKACRQLISLVSQSERNYNVFDLIRPEDREDVLTTLQQTLSGKPTVINTSLCNGDHYQISLQVKFIPMIMEQEVQGVYAIFKDMTTERFAKKALLASEERFRLIAEHSSDLIQLLNQQGELVYVSPSHHKVLGYDLDNLTRITLFDLVIPEFRQPLIECLHVALEHRCLQKYEAKFQDIKHNVRWFELQLEPVFTEDGSFKHTIVVARDIEERKSYEEELRRLAYHDPLTGLANRRLFNARLEQVITMYERKKNPFGVIMLDLDNFKGINDQNGHEAGDLVIVELGKRLKHSVREMDTVARLGGDEFIILLPELQHKSHLLNVVNRIEQAIQMPWSIKNKQTTVSVSIGVVMPETPTRRLQDIVIKADQALYEAKRTGKNKAIFYSV